MSKLAIDIDGCLANWNHAFAKLIIKVAGENKLPPNYEKDPTFPNCWQWPQYYGNTDEQVAEAWEIINNSTTFWEDLDPMPGTRGVLKCLSDLTMKGHEVYFLTFRTGHLVKKQTERWLDYQGMVYPTVIVASSKGPIVRTIGIDAMIDDHLPTANAVVRWNQVKRMYLMSASYNKVGREPNLIVVKCVREMLEMENLWE